MSKQSEAKKAQYYNPKPTQSMCSNCIHFTSDKEVIKSMYSSSQYTKESNLRCGIGGFAVKKMGLCNSHKLKIEALEL